MYLERFQLSEPPFTLSPDRKFFFTGGGHGEAFDGVRSALRNGERVIKIVGEAGSGKTSVCQELIHALDEGWTVIHFPDPFLTSQEMLLALAAELNVPQADPPPVHPGDEEARAPEEVGSEELLDRITKRLTELRRAGQGVALLADRAHALPLTALDALQRLATSETQSGALLQVVLCGRPELDSLVGGPAFSALRQRLISAHRLRAMDRFEVERYVAHRLAIAGCAQPDRLTRGALNTLRKASGGIPGQVNLICHEALKAADAAGSRVVGREHVRFALAQAGVPQRPQAKPAARSIERSSRSIRLAEMWDRVRVPPSYRWSLLAGPSIVAAVALLVAVPPLPLLGLAGGIGAVGNRAAADDATAGHDGNAVVGGPGAGAGLPPVSATGASVDAGPALLRGIQVEGPEAHTRLTIELSRLTGHSVEHDMERGDLQIVLSNTVVREPPSPILLRGTAIRAVKSDLVDRDLRLRLDVPNAMWTQVAMLAAPAPPRLVIDLAALSREVASPPPAKPAFPAERKRSRNRTGPSATDPKNAAQAYERGIALAEKDEVLDAIEQLWTSLSLDPTHVGAREALASLLLQSGRTDEAAQLLDEGLSVEPRNPSFAKLRARILLERGATEQALRLLEAAAPPVIDDPEYHALMAAVLLRGGQQARAAQRYWQVLEVEPDRGAWWLGLAIALEAENSPGQALMAYRTAATVGGLGPDSRQYVETRIGALQPRER